MSSLEHVDMTDSTETPSLRVEYFSIPSRSLTGSPDYQAWLWMVPRVLYRCHAQREDTAFPLQGAPGESPRQVFLSATEAFSHFQHYPVHWEPWGELLLGQPSSFGAVLASLVESDFHLLRGPSDIAQFLGAHPFLLDTLKTLPLEVRAVFGAGTQIALEVFQDREDSANRQLFALIQTSLDPAAAWRSMQELEDRWWSNASLETDYLLHVDVEFVP